MPDPSVRHHLARHYGALRHALLTRHALAAAGLSAVAIALAVALGVAFPTGVGGAWVRLALTLAAFLAAVTLAVRAVRRAVPAFDVYLERVETRFPEVRSWLRNALDLEAHPPVHGSHELASALAHETAKRMDGVALATLTPPIEPRRPALFMAGAFVLVMALALLMPARLTRSWATLWNPAAAAPAVRLEVEPGSVRITPGAALAVRARVWGSTQRPRLLLSRGTRVEPDPEGESNGARLWRFDLTQLTDETTYRVRVASVESPRYRIALAGEPQPVSFEIEYRAPAYARLPVQRGSATRGDLSALRGTRAWLDVTFDRDLTALESALPGGARGRWTALTPRRWRGEVPIEREGEYELHARAASGEARYRYHVSPLADAPPVLAVRTPEGDVDLPNGQIVPLEVMGQDDLGLSELRLEVRKDPQAPWTTLTLARFAGSPREAQVARRWDVSPLALLPGEVASFRFELFDDNAVSGRGVATSPVFQIRFPTLGDLYQQLEKRQDAAQNTLEKVAEQAKEQQKALDKLARQPQPPQPNANQPFENTPSPRNFERQEELKSALERQQQLAQKIEEASQQLHQNLDESSERKAFDEQLTRKLQEMAELMKQVQSPEFKDALKKMQEALERLDHKPLEQNLQQWRQENQDMLKNLERTVELLKQLREEERLQALAQRANELKAQQDQLNQSMQEQSKTPEQKQAAESKALAEQQNKAADETQKLSDDAKAAAKDSELQKDQKNLEAAAQELEQQAAPSQRQSATSQSEQQGKAAQQSGQRAAESLSRAADQLKKMAQEKREQQEGADLAAVRRAAQDLVSLQRESESNLQSAAPNAERADRQTDLSEGTARVADSLYQLARKTPFITPKLGESLGHAIQQLSNSGKDLSTGNRARAEDEGRSGSALLNQAVNELRNIESSMCEKPGGSNGNSSKPGPKPGPNDGGTAARMDRLGTQQQRLNQQSRSLAQRLSEQMQLSAGDRQELQRLAQEQQRIRSQLEQIQRDEDSKKQLLGRLDQAQQEMKEVEEAMRSGSSEEPLEEKQQRILSRLLDAQRSVNRRDFDPQRESHAGQDIVRSSPAELPQDLLRERDRLRMDLLKAEADRYPAQYRAFIESYLRSLNGSRR